MEYMYRCAEIENLQESSWVGVQGVELVETATGEPPRLKTIVKACRTQDSVCFRFECEDDHTVSRFTQRDEPLYDEDVVEIFIDVEGSGRHYQEYEISPRNVVFDALIDNDLAGTICVHTEWDAEGMRTAVRDDGNGKRIYVIELPFAVFPEPPKAGTEWRVNLYRIDEDPQGTRHYWAWSPTGAINYHIPQRFGRMVFV